MNADSFVTAANARIYAAARGVVLPSSDPDLEAMLVKATDYLEAQECLFQGKRVSSSQALAWPRTEVYLYGDLVPPNIIPQSLISAQIQLAMAIHAGLDLQPNITPEAYVIKEKVGPIETVYANPLQVGIMPTFTAANALLAPLFGICAANKFSIKTIRV